MKRFPGNKSNPLCMMLVAFMLLCSVSSVSAQVPEGKITGMYNAFDIVVQWDYAYSDDYFRMPADEYNHDLARLSLGLALSTFRDVVDHPDNQDIYLVDFLRKLGFENIDTSSFGPEPSSYSISYGFAELKRDDMTVVVVAVCGGNYGPEWASNLTVGSGERPYGFQDAAQKVQAALREYLERYPVGGNVKLWTTGFSRGGAVSNITAADCSGWDIFSDVYAYTFATPRTTMDPGNYTTIFNILQKNDVVPMIPLADWGYRRYGKDLYLLSPEMDIDRPEQAEKALGLYTLMTGSPMVVNYEMNYQIRTLCDYLCLLMPDAATYEQFLQPFIVDIMTSSDGTVDALMVLLEALQRYSLATDDNGEELVALREYLGTLISIYYLQDGISEMPADKWDPQMGLYNLFNEHFPFEYQSYLYASDDPEEVFSANTRYLRLVVYGNVDATIMDGDRVLKEILADGTELVDGKQVTGSLPYVECSDQKMVITLPSDRSFTVKVRSRSAFPQTVVYTGLIYSDNTTQAHADDMYSYLMASGEEAVITTSSNGRAIEPDGSSHTDVSVYVGTIYSPTTAMRLENNSVVHLTISGLVNRILLILVVLILQMIASIILGIIRKKKHRKRNDVVALVWHAVIAFMFALLEVAMWYFVPVLTIAKFIGGVLVYLVLAIYALKGYLVQKKRIWTFVILLVALTAYMILGSLILGDFAVWKAIMTLAVYAAYMAASFILLWKGR